MTKVKRTISRIDELLYLTFGLSSARAVCSDNGHVRFQRGCG